MTIVVQRSGALGDVVLTTPIIRRLRRENPAQPIAMLTAYGSVFRHSPHLNMPIPGGYPEEGARCVQLDMAYELHPGLHIVQAYMLEAFGDLGDPRDLQQELFFPTYELFSNNRNYVAVHAAVAGWGNRTLPRETWRAVVDGLRAEDLWPVLVGGPRDSIPGCDVTAFHSTDILAQASFISGCACFVGSDSGLLHVAGATDVPIVAVMTCAQPATRLPWRHGQLGWNCTAVVPMLDCVGCLQRRPPPVTTEHCERGDNLCVDLVQADAIVAAVVAAVQFA